MPAHADITIIGAGAAGLTAAIFAAQTARPDQRIVLLDSARRVGAKILVAGGGRCNVTHHQVTPQDYNAPPHLVRNVLRAFDVQRTIDWFASMGVALKHEPTGKLFPVTDQARTVLNALLDRQNDLGVQLLTDHRVTAIARNQDNADFTITHTHGTLRTRRLILATGGRSLPRTGSDGSGWTMVQTLGHTVTPTWPALVPVVLADDFFHARLSGVSQEVTLSIHAAGKRIDQRTGSLLWTHFGISGPVVMDASRFWIIANANGQQPQWRCAMVPEPFDAVEQWLIQAAATTPRRSLAALLTERVPRRVADLLAQQIHNPALGQITRAHRRQIVHALTDLTLPVLRDRGWNHAEVTAGGVPLTEIDYRTMASRQVEHLYLIGEMLDVDGRIGGFNFQWAWATGYLAGTAAARSLKEQT